MKTAAVIAAAGLSSRMHEFKPMLSLGNTTMIERLVGNFRMAGVEEIIVVGGYRASILRKHLESQKVVFCENKSYAATQMFDSVKIGLLQLKGTADAVFITPGDVPLVKVSTLQTLMQADREAVRPFCGEKGGHPVLIKTCYVPEILRYNGESGLKGALTSVIPGGITDVAVDDIGAVADADTPQDYLFLRELERESRNDGRLWAEADVIIGNRNVIVNAERARFYEMIRQTGSIRYACSSLQISYTKGWTLIKNCERCIGFPLVTKVVGGSGGGETKLTEKGLELLDLYNNFREKLQKEMTETFEKELEQWREKKRDENGDP